MCSQGKDLHCWLTYHLFSVPVKTSSKGLQFKMEFRSQGNNFWGGSERAVTNLHEHTQKLTEKGSSTSTHQFEIKLQVTV